MVKTRSFYFEVRVALNGIRPMAPYLGVNSCLNWCQRTLELSLESMRDSWIRFLFRVGLKGIFLIMGGLVCKRILDEKK